MSTGGGNNKDDPREGGDTRDTTPLDPLDIPEADLADIDAGWDLGTDDLLGPDEGPTVVDGSLEMAVEAAMEQPATREPSRTFLGLGPSDQLAPAQEEPTAVAEISQPVQQEPPPPEPLPEESISALANLAAQDVAFKDTLPGDLNQLTPEVVPAEPEPEKQAPFRPTPPVTEAALKQPLKPPTRRRPPAETEPTEPMRLPPDSGSRKSASALALAATMAPDASESMAHAPTLAPGVNSGLRTLDAVVQAPAPVAPAPAPTAQASAAPQLDEPTQTVAPITQQPRTPARAPSNMMLTALWVLALISVIVAVGLFLLKPSI